MPVCAIIAGAGCGKTTLMRQIFDEFSGETHRKVWLALDKRHSSYAQFWDGLVHAIAADTQDPSTYEQLTLAKRLDSESQAQLLGNVIAASNGHFVLFIDDFHITNAGQGESVVGHLVHQQPQNLQILLASRSKPDINLNTLIADNRVLEFTWRDLMFSNAEVQSFFNTERSDPLPARLTERIHRDTEGWPVGLQMAFIKSRIDGNIQPEDAKFHYEGDIGRYFETQILSSFEPEIVDILVRTGVLDRFNDDMAAAVADVTIGEAVNSFNYLRDAEFFITPLGGEGGWRKYHSLAQDYLLDRAKQDPAIDVPELYNRASLWWEQIGGFPESIEYAIRATNYERAASLVEAHALTLFSLGAAPELASWIERIPDKINVERPQLPLLLCLMQGHTQQPKDVYALQYDKAKQTIATLRAIGHIESDHEYETLLAELDITEALLKFVSGDMPSVVDVGQRMLSNDTSARPIFVAVLQNMVGYAQYAAGQNDLARMSLANGKELHLAASCVFGVVFSEAFLGMVELSEGKTKEALDHFNQGLRYARSELGSTAQTTSAAKLYLYLLQSETNELDRSAAEDIGLTLKRCRYCSHPEIYANLLQIQALLLAQQDRANAAREVLHEAVRFGREFGNDSICLEALYRLLQLEITQSNTAAGMDAFVQAQEFWNDLDERDGATWDRHAFWRDVFRAEIYLITAQPSKAVALYEGVLKLVDAGNRVRKRIFVLTKSAEALAVAGNQTEALRRIEQTLHLAYETRIVRPLIDAATPVRNLIGGYHKTCDDIDMQAFIEAALGVSPSLSESGLVTNAASTTTLVVEELTDREKEILGHLMKGAKNAEICDATNLKHNTVKWYLKRIFEKLSVKNRTEAAIVARTIFASN